MSDWKRSTRELSLDQLSNDMQAEFQKHIERYNLGDIFSDALMCIETISETAKKDCLVLPNLCVSAQL